MSEFVIGKIEYPPIREDSQYYTIHIDDSRFGIGIQKPTKNYRIIALKTSGFNPNDFLSEHWTEKEAELEIENLNYDYPLGLLVKTSDWSLTKVYVNSNWYVYKSKQTLRSME